MDNQEGEFSLKDFVSPLTNFKAILWISIIGLIVFANSLFNGYAWDDKSYILQNPEIKSISPGIIFGPSLFNDSYSGYYRPIPALYFSLLNLFIGNTLFFYHLIQVLIHIICSILVYLFFKKYFEKKLAFVLSIIFLIHPIQVESVAYISQTVSPLFFLFGIIALYIGSEKELSVRRKILIFTLLLICILTKETGIMFILLFIVYRVYIKKDRILEILPGIGVLVIYTFLRTIIGKVGLTHYENVEIGQISLLHRIGNIPIIFLYYLKTFIFPAALSVDQKWVVTHFDFLSFYIPLIVSFLILLAICIFGVYLWKKSSKDSHLYIFFVTWFLFSMLMVVQLFPLDMTVAERWFYMPMVGLLGILGLIIKNTEKRLKKVALITTVVFICILSIRTIIRNANWQDELTLFAHDSKHYTNYKIETSLSGDYFERGDIENTILHAKKSVDLYPYELNLTNLGTLYLYTGKPDLAVKYLEMAIDSKHNTYVTKKHLSSTYKRLALAYILNNNPSNAKLTSENGLQEYSNDAWLWYEEALSEYLLKNTEKAITLMEKAMTLENNELFDSVYINMQQNVQIDPSTLDISPILSRP